MTFVRDIWTNIECNFVYMWYNIIHKMMKLDVVVDIRSCVFIYPWDYVKFMVHLFGFNQELQFLTN